MPDAAADAQANPGRTVLAPINFMAPGQDAKPQVMMSANHAQPNQRTGEFAAVTVQLRDARALTPPASLDVQGFELADMPTAMADFYDDARIEAVYYPEIIEFLKRTTGATDVHIFDHTVRVQDDGKRAATAKRLPVLIAHNDYTEKSGPKRVRDVMEAADADRFLGHRFAMVNVWRSIGESAERTPVAMADARTMRTEDYIATDLVYQDRLGEIYQNAHSDDQEWYWYPDMGGNEVLLLKCFDTATDGRARYTGHTGFENPSATPDTPPRESIEVRTMISFAPKG
ncbi:MAG: methyltransferase [Rhodospirillales bacterium CG15_BIG_FIL_POST_REV_8_21_14_020_66_15]|nr:MAG: methyltransferase [Rhodospirillales bacterium CG15_BIG_FIL_POST_REV_8_21_14_020_66_15]